MSKFDIYKELFLLNFLNKGKAFYIGSYVLGFVLIAIFDFTLISDDIILFIFISPIVASLVGFIALFCIAILLNAICFFKNTLCFMSKKVS